MNFNLEKLNEATKSINEEMNELTHFANVLARLIVRSFSEKTREAITSKKVYELKVSDFGKDLEMWLDKGLTFNEIMNLIAKEVSNLWRKGN